MSAFYQRMKTNVADKLLNKFQQGSIELVRRTTVAGTNPWDEPIVTEVSHKLAAIASGVAQEYVDGVTIFATDLQIVSAVPDGEIVEYINYVSDEKTEEICINRIIRLNGIA